MDQSKIHCILLCILFYSANLSCKGQASTEEYIKAKYPFKPVQFIPMPDSMKAELYIPFYHSGKYFISDFEGKRKSSQSWDEIHLTSKGPFFWAGNEGLLNLYKYPETLILDVNIRVLHREHLPNIMVRGTSPESIYYRVKIDTVLVPPEGPFVSARDSIVKARKNRDEIVFFIPHDVSNPITTWYYKADHQRPGSEKKINSVWNENYDVVMTREFLYNLVGPDGNKIFKDDFWEIPRKEHLYIVALNKEGKFAMGNVQEKTMTGYVYDRVEEAIAEGASIKAKLNVTERPGSLVPFYNPDNQFSGVKDSLGNVILPPVYEHVEIAQEMGWIFVNTDSMYGICTADSQWIFPWEARGLDMGIIDTSGSVSIRDRGQILIFNLRMELEYEEPVIFQTPDYYAWHFVPDSLQPVNKPGTRVPRYRPFNIYNDGYHGYVFNSVVSTSRGIQEWGIQIYLHIKYIMTGINTENNLFQSVNFYMVKMLSYIMSD